MNSVKKLLQLFKDEDTETIISLMDIIISMIPHLESNNLRSCFKVWSHFYRHENGLFRKKSYKGIALIFSNALFDWQEEKEIIKIISCSITHTENFKSYYAALLSYVEHMPSSMNGDLIVSMIPQVIIGVKEINQTIRQMCFSILDMIGKRLINQELYFSSLNWDTKTGKSK